MSLKIAKKLKSQLATTYPDINIIMTRNADVFIPLHKRAAITNKAKADLFISIHCNAMSNANYIKGTETYVLGLHKADENLKVAKRENASVLLEDNYQDNYSFDPNSDEGYIMLSMFQNAYLEQSISIAEKIEKKMAASAQRHSRGVKQAGFIVLHQTTMPSVLVETGFLTNATEEAYLRTDKGQQKIANAIAEAFSSYKKEVESTTPTYVATATANAKSQNTTIVNTPSKASKPKKTVLLEPFPEKEDASIKGKVQFRVQLAAHPTPIDISKGKWSKADYLIQVVQEDGLYKYQANHFYSLEDANRAKKILQNRGFNDAWIVAYRNGKRIDIQEAIQSNNQTKK